MYLMLLSETYEIHKRGLIPLIFGNKLALGIDEFEMRLRDDEVSWVFSEELIRERYKSIRLETTKDLKRVSTSSQAEVIMDT